MFRTALALLSAITLLASLPGVQAATATGLAAGDLAAAMAVHGSLVGGATFDVLSGPSAVGVSDDVVAGFPTWGSDYAVLSSGLAGGGDASYGGTARGANDVTILAIDLEVPAGANCVWFAFRFLTNDYGPFNDAFVAELDVSDWAVDTSSSNQVHAPHNFAEDSSGNPIGVSTADLSPEGSTGTPYVLGTSLLYAASPVTPGPHTLYLSVFDMYDQAYDSAVYLDGLDAGSVAPSLCASGAASAPAAPTPELGTFLLAAGGLAVAVVAFRRLR